MCPFANDPYRAVCRRRRERPHNRAEDSERSLWRGRRAHGQAFLGPVYDEHRHRRISIIWCSHGTRAPEQKGWSRYEEDAR